MGYYRGDYYMAGQAGALAKLGTAAAKGGLGRGLATLGKGLGLGALFGLGEEAVEGAISGAGSAATAIKEALGGGGRSYRRMNVLNPRALRRSMRRVQGFAKFARKTISFTQRVKMKKRRK